MNTGGTGKGVPTPYIAHHLRRILVGQTLNGELKAFEGPFRRVAEHLNRLPPESRPQAWDGFLCGCDDAGSIVRALAAADPHGPAPDVGEDSDPDAFSLDLMDSADFFSQEFPTDWRIKGVQVANEPGAIGGPSKALKTSILVDMTVSLATGTPFLGRFEVPRAIRVGLISGESGRRVIQSSARQVYIARGLTSADLGNVFWGFKLPQITNAQHLVVLRKTIEDRGIEQVALDPFYLMLLAGNAGVDPKNMFEMGPILSDVSQACIEAGCTPIIAHHFAKKRDDPFGPPELSEFAYGGFGQFIRQWMMVAPRERFDAEVGLFKLHFNYGGSAGHCGEFAVDIEVGKLDPDMDRRCWKVTVATPSEFRSTREEQRREERERVAAEKEIVKANEKVRKEREDMRAAVKVFRAQPDRRLVANTLKASAGWNTDRVKRTLFLLVAEGHVREFDTTVPRGKTGTQPATGYELIAGKEVIP